LHPGAIVVSKASAISRVAGESLMACRVRAVARAGQTRWRRGADAQHALARYCVEINFLDGVGRP
jgi:hypothetical protein